MKRKLSFSWFLKTIFECLRGKQVAELQHRTVLPNNRMQNQASSKQTFPRQSGTPLLLKALPNDSTGHTADSVKLPEYGKVLHKISN